MFGAYHLPFLKHFQVVGHIEPFFKVDNIIDLHQQKRFLVESATSPLFSLLYSNNQTKNTTNSTNFTDYRQYRKYTINTN
jgi:hypothetical protein